MLKDSQTIVPSSSSTPSGVEDLEHLTRFLDPAPAENLIVDYTATVLWLSGYTERRVAEKLGIEVVPPFPLTRIAPLGWAVKMKARVLETLKAATPIQTVDCYALPASHHAEGRDEMIWVRTVTQPLSHRRVLFCAVQITGEVKHAATRRVIGAVVRGDLLVDTPQPVERLKMVARYLLLGMSDKDISTASGLAPDELKHVYAHLARD